MKPEKAATTHPALLAALTQMLRERGANVVIGDSPGGTFAAPHLNAVYRVCGLSEAEAAGAELNRDFPETTIILNHTGLPADRSAEGLAGWRTAMKALAAAPNVAVKISGLGERGREWSLSRNRGIITETIDIFGAARCMFASNFPVDGLVGGFRTIYAGFDEATRHLGPDTQRALFADNARRFYRIAG